MYFKQTLLANNTDIDSGVAQTPIGVDVERTSPTGLPFKQATSEKLLSGLPG